MIDYQGALEIARMKKEDRPVGWEKEFLDYIKLKTRAVKKYTIELAHVKQELSDAELLYEKMTGERDE